jgi:ethanolamine ammonia-lyase small subunit
MPCLAADRKRLQIGLAVEARGLDKTGVNGQIDALEKIRDKMARQTPGRPCPSRTGPSRATTPTMATPVAHSFAFVGMVRTGSTEFWLFRKSSG